MQTVRRNPGRVAALAATLAILAAAPAAQGASTRVVGGAATSSSAYPWQAAVVRDASRFGGNDFSRQFCGGVLVAPRIVLTAGHCVYNTDPDLFGGQLDANDADVVLGATSLSAGGARHDLAATALQPGYDPTAGTRDVAYLILSAPSSQQPIKLAGPTETALWTPGSPTIVTGWGSTSEGGGRSDTLLAGTVPIIDDATCGSPSVYGGTFFSSSEVCAGYLAGGVDACQGDSGGPLQAPAAGGIFRLVGLVSSGDGCARPNKPGIYARVGAGPPGVLFNDVVAQVASLEATYRLGHTDIVGIGATSLVPPVSEASAPKRRCAKGKRLLRRHGKRRCFKRRHAGRHHKHR